MAWVILAIVAILGALLPVAYFKGRKDERQRSLAHTVEDLIKTKEKQEIPLRKGRPTPKAGVNPALIKAWAHETTPVPDFSFTDFFTQLYPRGAIERQSAGENAPHDRASGRHSFHERSKAHAKKRSSSELPDDEQSED